ncbi:DUF433 domain-containing protein [Hylemonella sp. W303a]|uniref:DUF433 domain-containing protein n=1 Tax=Hylemonella sp. W303a TaxID=3389873 RepID=UPI00396B30FF
MNPLFELPRRSALKFRLSVGIKTMISVDPDVMGGLPCFAGTRVPIDNVLGSLEQGVDVKHLYAAYPFLTAEHILAGRLYAASHPRNWPSKQLSDTYPGAQLVSKITLQRIHRS